MDMMNMSFPDKSFDFIYSSLAFHYANNWDHLLKEIRRVLKKGSELLFSTHNPEYWGLKEKTGNFFTNERGITLTEHTAVLPAANIKIIFYNHPNMESIIDALNYAGFKVELAKSPSAIELPAGELMKLSSKERGKYEKIKEKNATPLFLVIKAIAV